MIKVQYGKTGHKQFPDGAFWSMNTGQSAAAALDALPGGDAAHVWRVSGSDGWAYLFRTEQAARDYYAVCIAAQKAQLTRKGLNEGADYRVKREAGIRRGTNWVEGRVQWIVTNRGEYGEYSHLSNSLTLAPYDSLPYITQDAPYMAWRERQETAHAL